jgi:hypothetical protein
LPILRWTCAHGEAAGVTLACAEIVAIAPFDDSVDTNVVRIEGEGEIAWFGDGPPVIKWVIFGPSITLKNSDRLELLCGTDRVVTTPAVGRYMCDGEGHWSELHFAATGNADLSRRLDAIERRLSTIEARLKEGSP